MNNKVKLTLIVLALFSFTFSSKAFALPIKIMSCYQVPMPENSGTRIDIVSQKYPNRNLVVTKAYFYEENFEGEQLLSNHMIREVQTDTPESTRLFIARWFKIELDLKATPINNMQPAKFIRQDQSATASPLLCNLK